ncbi:DUF2380 domain-containing protein [Myxococcus llanfairpwllgwyngyllgogerychwyrndrobwllllantysiliogogogochensis]|uniref:DUF2380 domain-containing protein n=1 Tax=Myxococcus llanfairpwllgwyngyllgogerychwyrndrobwllllantysiliogogogochensis TaxID=2590453 RepID=A0A540WJ67_9BACT|nr:DUF2380 domain-containing protein [Myxococcus llanfairpwllgwyngyllgogerychwyrndrobwllllantysiliogogogochensis]TQF09065.1 DUF2380 domain-containing protein [Myxococcus llanfairpwllgwyngyllgogerychwyrndrobwllllantysiliogogogochensis]
MRARLLVLSLALLTTGCISVPHAPARGRTLNYTPRAATPPEGVDIASDERPGAFDPSPYSIAGSWPRQRFVRHGGARIDATKAASGAVGGGAQTGASPRQAVLDAIDEVKGTLDGVEGTFTKLAAHRPRALGEQSLNDDGLFSRFVEHGSAQVTWLRGGLGSATGLTEVASEVGDPDMELGVLRMTGPKLQATMFGTLLLATWVDFLQFSAAIIKHCFVCSDEKLFVDLHRVQRLMEPTLKDLESLDPERVEAAATAMPELMGKLTQEFAALQAQTRESMRVGEKVLTAAQVLEMVSMISTLKMSLPRLPPAAPVTLGMSLAMGSGGVMMGSRIVVSAEWVEMMRRLVQAGVISLPAVNAAVRIHGGQVMMAQAYQDLPQGVRDALGDSPEVRGMHVTGKAGAGMSEAPKHHVLPKEHREWFEQRGFKGDMDIDQFCVRLEKSQHEAIHGGGNWRLGRTWPGEWNRMLMKALSDAEVEAGRRLTRNAVLDIVADRMKDYRIPMNFVTGRRR